MLLLESQSSQGVLRWLSACPNVQRPWVPAPAPHKPNVVLHACDPSTQEVDTGGSEVQGHPEPYNKHKASVGYMTPCLEKAKQAACMYDKVVPLGLL